MTQEEEEEEEEEEAMTARIVDSDLDTGEDGERKRPNLLVSSFGQPSRTSPP